MKKYLRYMIATLGVATGIVGAFSLSSCGGKNDKNLTGTMTVSPTAKTLIITCGITDPDGVVNQGSARVAVYEYNNNDTPDDTSDDTQTLKENKTFSNLPNSDGSLETETVSNLKVNQDYLVKFYCTYGDEIHVFEETHYSTNNKGQTIDNPIEISTAKQLYSMTDDTEAFYKLTSDINLEDYSGYSSDSGVSPIFTSSTPFKGHFDGQGHKITGFMEKTSIQQSGLFGYVEEEAVVENVDIESPTIDFTRSSTGYLGVLCGVNKGTINNCNVTNANLTYTVNVTTLSTPVIAGGFVGTNEGTITNCSITGTINSTYRGMIIIGGFVGENENKITDCKSDVDLKLSYGSSASSVEYVTFDVGGFAGKTDGTILNCLAEGSLDVTYSFTDTNTSINKNIPHNVGGFAGMYIGGLIKGCVTYLDIAFTSTQSLSTNFGLFVGNVATGLNPKACENNVVVGQGKTITIKLLREVVESEVVKYVYNYERNVLDENGNTITETTDRKFNFGFLNSLDTSYVESFNENAKFAVTSGLKIECDATDYVSVDYNEGSAYTNLTLPKSLVDFIVNIYIA